MKPLIAFLLVCSALFAGPREDVDCAFALLTYRRSSLPIVPDDLGKTGSMPELTRQTVPKTDPKKTTIHVWASSSCSRCEALKRDYAAGKLDRWNVIIEPGPTPANVKAFPTIRWHNSRGKEFQLEEWGGPEWFAAWFDSAERATKTEPMSGGYYPLRGNIWTGPCGQVPLQSRHAAIRHLQEGEHAGKFSRSYLESLSLQELNSLHSADHEGRVQWQHVQGTPRRTRPSRQRSCPTCPRRDAA